MIPWHELILRLIMYLFPGELVPKYIFELFGLGLSVGATIGALYVYMTMKREDKKK